MELMLTKVGVDSIINGVLVIPIGVTRISTDAINEECAKLIKVVLYARHYAKNR